MKRGWKIFWITCGAVAGTGAACMLCGAAMGATLHAAKTYFPDWIGPGRAGAAVYEHGDGPSETETDGVYRDIRSLHLETEGLSVQILAGEDGKVTVRTEDVDPNLELEVKEEEGELRVETMAEHLPLRLNSRGHLGNVWIYLPPAAALEKADLTVGVGELYVEEIQAEELDLEVGTGSAEVDRFTAGDLDVEVGVGAATLEGVTRRDADLSCDLGSLAYTDAGRMEDFNYELDCGVGELRLDGDKYSGIDVEKYIDNRADKTMQISCDVGSADIRFAGQQTVYK